MPKNNRSGQAAILTESDILKIRRQLTNKSHRLFWDLARYTGERWGAICKLKVSDVYLDPYRAVPHLDITFPAAIRKASPDGSRATRQVPVHPALKEILEAYKPPDGGWLFPSSTRSGCPITFQAADDFLQRALVAAQLGHKGISTHSTRRSFITALYLRGVDLVTLQKITGHKDLKSLQRYVEISPDRVRRAIAIL